MKFIKTMLKGLIGLIVILGLFLWLGPRETVNEEVAFASVVIPEDIDGYLNDKETQFSDIIEDAHKQVIWAGAVGEQTEYSVLYVHGFSGTSHEIRPVPEDVANALGANLYYTRMAGHGRSGDAMMDGSPEKWVQDVIEAIEIGGRLGQKVIVLATSNGGAVTTYVLNNPEYADKVAGVVLTSPAYKLGNPLTALLDFPWVRHWGNYVVGERRGFKGENADHEKYWTNEYPTLSTLSMATVQRAVRKMDFSTIEVPALFFVSNEDKVIDPAWVKDVASRWGIGAQVETRVMTEQDDPYHHVLSGDILSPNQTAETTSMIVEWAKGLE
ncbi:alpha/beta hydrolase [Amylibacter sp. SFDW26]|uniref:alpha/beta hydrolase n=1 Tax=Amylibacter sp. SFDW26 TaxID=2652722 RepID=UPI001262AA26|nr:alpha/beta fold hydrolase [Amylibacter sp. SFDW26]KAB7613646.1 alpha/beta hydrolase [Amylibacter sp. SFDW26]